LDDLIVRQQRALKDLNGNSSAFISAATVLRLLEREQGAIIEELGYNPRSN
jgi:hypothetical protein